MIGSATIAGGARSVVVRALGRIGDAVVDPLLGLRDLTGMTAAVVSQGLRPSSWRRTVRAEFVRHCDEAGVRALPAVLALGVLVGLGLVLQAQYWLGLFGQADVLGPLLVLVLVRELGPLTVALMLVGRSATVHVTELHALRTSGRLNTLDAMGVDPFHLLVLPRVTALAVCCFGLTMALLASALIAGYVGSRLAGLSGASLGEFLGAVVDGMAISEFVLVLVKPLLIGFAVGLIACVVALLPTRESDGLPTLLPRAFGVAMGATLVISALVSVLL